MDLLQNGDTNHKNEKKKKRKERIRINTKLRKFYPKSIFRRPRNK